MKRVVITGVGAITPLGKDVNILWQSLIDGKSGISLISSFDTSELTSKIAGEITDFETSEYLNTKDAKRLDRYTHFAVAATKNAVSDSKLENYTELNKEKVGIILGSGIGGIGTFADQHTVFMEKGAKRVSPFFITMMISNIAAGYIATEYKFYGENYTIVSACASSGHAIFNAYRSIKIGSLDVVITGGSEAPIIPMSMAGFCSNKSLSRRNDEPELASRPWDKDRDGFVMGEGGGIIILEDYEHAKRRGAEIYAELVGVGASSDAYHFTAPPPDGSGAYRAMHNAVLDANLTPSDIDYINAHGTSTVAGDIAESVAIKRYFSENLDKIKVSSIKSMLGHLLGASGAVEAIVTIMTLRTGIIPPTINLENVDPECEGIDYVPNKAIKKDVNYAISNSFGFGGHNVSLLFKKFEG